MNKSKIRIFISNYNDYVKYDTEPLRWFMYMVSDERYIDRYNIKAIYK